MNRKKTIARIAAGFLSVVTFLSAVIGPVPAMAADSDANSVYIEDYPELKDVRDMLDEDEIVKAEDITVDADEDFEIKKDFKGIDYSSKKVKISLYDDDGFSSSKEGSYKPVYHADPKSGNHGYRFSRRITVVKKEVKKEASSSGASNQAGSSAESHGENSSEKEAAADDAEEGNEPKDPDGKTESAGQVSSNKAKEVDDPELDESKKDLLLSDDGNGSTADEATVLQEERTAGEEASASAEMNDEKGNRNNGSLSAEGNTAASETASETETANGSSTEADTADESSIESEAAEPSENETAAEGSTDAAAEDATLRQALMQLLRIPLRQALMQLLRMPLRQVPLKRLRKNPVNLCRKSP